MASPDEPQGAGTPSGENSPETQSALPPSQPVSGEVLSDETYSYSDNWSSSSQSGDIAALTSPPASAPPVNGGGGSPPKKPDPPEEEDEEEGMARMSFMEHLEELRKRILLALGGLGLAFGVSMIFGSQLWDIVQRPAHAALVNLGVNPPDLILISPIDAFQIIWMKLPLLCALFIGSPWILYQVWAFIAPGLYERERRWAVPFVISSAGLFIAGGFFAYFIAFRSGLEFLLGIGMGHGIHPGINVVEYYDLFVDVMLGVGIVFEIPVLLFLLTLIRVASPRFLVRHSRYAILVIVIVAAVITPTGDVFNLSLFATPMIVLFYVGIFASYLLVLKREKQRFPWAQFAKWFGIGIILISAALYFIARYYGYQFVLKWPPVSK